MPRASTCAESDQKIAFMDLSLQGSKKLHGPRPTVHGQEEGKDRSQNQLQAVTAESEN
jgi:hypothetical protein